MITGTVMKHVNKQVGGRLLLDKEVYRNSLDALFVGKVHTDDFIYT